MEVDLELGDLPPPHLGDEDDVLDRFTRELELEHAARVLQDLGDDLEILSDEPRLTGQARIAESDLSLASADLEGIAVVDTEGVGRDVSVLFASRRRQHADGLEGKRTGQVHPDVLAERIIRVAAVGCA